ncbi:hypothetical protein K3495_g870 [Podosphaera aphanis]|nr:hypothetical protein K3495_g870 [Podosphaera aphanis]
MYNQGKPIPAASARFNQQHPVENGHNYYHSHALPSSQPYQKPMNFYNRANSHSQSHDSYSKEQVLAQNPESRVPNYGSNQNSRPNNSKNNKSVDTKPLPPKRFSKNPYVNGSQSWNKLMGLLCIRRGTVGHASLKCDSHGSSILENWEQAYLKEIVFSIDARIQPIPGEGMRILTLRNWNLKNPAARALAANRVLLATIINTWNQGDSHNKLVLHPKNPEIKGSKMNIHASSSIDSDDSESESESDISLNDELFENPEPHQETKIQSVHFSESSSKK